MGINQPGARQNTDGTTTIQMATRPSQLEGIAKAMRDFADDPTPDAILRVSRMADQVEIIADEIRAIPSNELLASRIYGCLKDHADSRSFGRDGSFVPSFVHNDILRIMNDPYAHLTDEQRRQIESECAEILSAGDGGDNTMPLCDARVLLLEQSIEEMMRNSQVDDWSKRLDFDPETGLPWDKDQD